MEIRIVCVECHSHRIVKNGLGRSGKQNYKCKDCGRQFMPEGQNFRITDEKKERIKRLLLERNSLRAIARIEQVSLSWVVNFVKEFYKNEQAKGLEVSAEQKKVLTAVMSFG